MARAFLAFARRSFAASVLAALTLAFLTLAARALAARACLASSFAVSVAIVGDLVSDGLAGLVVVLVLGVAATLRATAETRARLKVG